MTRNGKCRDDSGLVGEITENAQYLSVCLCIPPLLSEPCNSAPPTTAPKTTPSLSPKSSQSDEKIFNFITRRPWWSEAAEVTANICPVCGRCRGKGVGYKQGPSPGSHADTQSRFLISICPRELAANMETECPLLPLHPPPSLPCHAVIHDPSPAFTGEN